jgi:segregation and condensation protein A
VPNLAEPTAPPAPTFEATEGGIEFLVKLAASGEIDPKNVDVIDVTDRFLQAIAAAPKENLRQSGKILFHASVLLRMKAEALLADRTESIDGGGDDFLDFGDGDGSLIYDANKQIIARQITLEMLEKALVRRANNRQNRQRKVTLDQLVHALKEAERIEKARSERKPKARIQLAGYQEVRDVDDILELAHDEDIESTIERSEKIFLEMNPGDCLALVGLVRKLGGRADWVDAFLAALFLSNAGKIRLEQSTFYGPLLLIRCEPEAPVLELAKAE